MAVKTYTPRELLCFKHTPVGKELYNQLQEKLRQDQELGEVLRMPLERPLPRIMEEPADTSGGSENISPRRSEAVRQLDGTESEWRYRGRNDSEAIGAQPISAPTGLAAQKDEGFQRFYRAVVSPTHVRVTAGGRIVPNTRGSPSPTTRWPRDKPAVEAATNSASRPPNREPLQQSQFAMPQPFGFFPQHAMIPSFASGMVPAMPAMPAGPAPFPIMPWQVGFNIGGAIGLAPHPMSHVQGLVAMPPNSASNDRQSEAGASDNATPTRVSPPEHSDAARPIIHNGQWMVPPGASFHPFAMGHHPGFLGHPMMPPMAAGHRYIPSHIMAPMAQNNGQIPQAQALPLPHPMGYPTVPNLILSAGQHQSSIRASQITKRQLSVLRASLKWAEDQLQYNKHQIDERTMEIHAHSLRHSIEHFEKLLDEQEANEKSGLPKDETKDDMSDSASADEERSKSPVTSSAKPENSADSVSSLPDEASIVRTEKEKPIAFRPSNDDTGLEDALASLGLSSSDDAGANKRSSALPVTAALAPPFQPRAVGGQASGDRVPHSNHFRHMYEEEVSAKPYLVGSLPRDMNAEHARDTDYVYPRQLTEDELRARHMYWGKAPHHLQSGLPKFDGKDFYPPSPARSHSPENDSVLNQEHDSVLANSSEVASSVINTGVEVDPFQLPRRTPRQFGRGAGISVESDSSQQSGTSGKDSVLIVNRSRQDAGKKTPRGSRHPIAATNSPNTRSESDSPDENDEKNLVFKGRNSLRQTRPRPRSGIWHDMMKRGTSSSNAVPGTVSSTTAQGVLPHYSGHASASLAPSATNINSSPREQATKSGNTHEGGSISPAAERQIENRPPGDGKFNAHLGVQGSKKRPSAI
ncbi:hypothetical protein TARUN_6010 [Trichoderma arundinaceum]|uniref:Uncharacterized protein n=1 Tax=Trichoderma arundinaceum TaxID=490622 RepID=A0A395NK00_TRIAR|nr:hypothetical protein TARUN_6010 [Trichoderma arundinaceum]